MQAELRYRPQTAANDNGKVRAKERADDQTLIGEGTALVLQLYGCYVLAALLLQLPLILLLI